MLKKLLLLWRHRKCVRVAIGREIALLESGSIAQALGGLTDQEIAGLISWLPDEGTFVEFGTLFGLTAKAIARAKPKLKILAVDNFSWNPFGLPTRLHKEFISKILANEIQSGQVVVIDATSEAFRRTCKVVPDAAFFDALHQYQPVKDEISWAKMAGVKCICGHDYGNPNPLFGVTKAVDEEYEKIDRIGMCWRGLV